MLDYYLFKQVNDLFLQGKEESAKMILQDLQEKYIETCDENTLLKTQLQEYEDILYLAKNLEYDGNSYWLKTGTIKQGPFCQRCFDKDGLLIRLNEQGSKWRCLTCGVEYKRAPETPLEQKQQEPTGKVISNKVIQLYK